MCLRQPAYIIPQNSTNVNQTKLNPFRKKCVARNEKKQAQKNKQRGRIKLNETRRKIGTLFLTFLKIGAFTFGGGYAMIALLEDEFVERRKWMDQKSFVDMVAIAESTPGPVAINSATYIGYQTCGVLGALAATIAVCLPSLAMIYAISLFLDRFLSLVYVAYAFKGIRVCVVYLILSAGLKLLKGLEKTAFNAVVFCLTAGLFIAFSLFAVNFSSIYYILLSGAAGLGVCIFRKNMRKGAPKK